jgi:hypothetical protein
MKWLTCADSDAVQLFCVILSKARNHVVFNHHAANPITSLLQLIDVTKTSSPSSMFNFHFWPKL